MIQTCMRLSDSRRAVSALVEVRQNGRINNVIAGVKVKSGCQSGQIVIEQEQTLKLGNATVRIC